MIWFIIILAIILRLVSLNQSLWLDESINVLATTNFSFLGMIKDYAVADFHPPGFFAILWLWTILFGIGEIAVRIPSVVFGVLTIGGVYLIGKKLHSQSLGLLAALLLAVNPLHIYYSQEARMYALATLAVCVNMFLYIKLIKGDKVNLIALVLANLAVLASDYVAYFIFPAQFFLLVYYYKQKFMIKKYLIALIIAIMLGFWWIPIFIRQLDAGASASEALPTWKLVVGSYDPKALPLTFVKFIIGRISYYDKLIYGLILLPIVSIFSYLLLRGVKYADKLLIIWLIVPITLATFISLFIPVYNYFRVLYTIPSFLLMLSLGILSFKGRLRYILLTAIILVEVVSSLIYLSNPVFQREDWRGLVKFLKTKEDSMTLFESSGNFPPFDYYSKGGIKSAGALKNFPARDDTDLADLESLLKEFNKVYLVNYLVDISDPNKIVAKKIESLGFKLEDTVDFNGVGFVYNFKR